MITKTSPLVPKGIGPWIEMSTFVTCPTAEQASKKIAPPLAAFDRGIFRRCLSCDRDSGNNDPRLKKERTRAQSVFMAIF
jgi:hypothetical protein